MFSADNLELKHCFKISKELYECLKRLERKRESSSPFGNTKASILIKARDRARSYPFEYYMYKDGNVQISISKEADTYYVTTTNWYSRKYPNAVYNSFVDAYALNAGKNLNEAVEFFRQVIDEYILQFIVPF